MHSPQELDDRGDASASGYTGRWVARLRGRIIAQGGTPAQALRAAQSSRYKETPEIDYVPLNLPVSPMVEKIRGLLPDHELYLVGGAVRDMLLGRSSHDLDFAVPLAGIDMARRVAGSLKGDFQVLDGERDTGRVILHEADGARIFLDFAAYRGEGDHYPGPDLETDLRCRDFTINAIAYDVRTGVLLDPMDGGADLRAKRIHACTDRSMQDDPVRVLRGVRLAARLDFKIEPGTRRQMKEAAAGLKQASVERQRDELFKIFDGPKPEAAIRALDLLGALKDLLPELDALKRVEQSAPHVYDVWNHTLAVLQNLESILAALRVDSHEEETDDLFTESLAMHLGRFREQLASHLKTELNADRSYRALLFLTALYHDICKPSTRTVEPDGRIRFLGHDQQGAEVAAERAGALRLSNDEIDRLRVIIKEHMRFHYITSRMEKEGRGPSRKTIYRFFRDSGPAGPDLVLFGLADLRGTRAGGLNQETWMAALDVARILLENFWEKPEESVSPPRLLDGKELIKELGIEPGPRLGQLIDALREAQATGKVTTREDAVKYARSWLMGSQGAGQ